MQVYDLYEKRSAGGIDRSFYDRQLEELPISVIVLTVPVSETIQALGNEAQVKTYLNVEVLLVIGNLDRPIVANDFQLRNAEWPKSRIYRVDLYDLPFSFRESLINPTVKVVVGLRKDGNASVGIPEMYYPTSLQFETIRSDQIERIGTYSLQENSENFVQADLLYGDVGEDYQTTVNASLIEDGEFHKIYQNLKREV